MTTPFIAACGKGNLECVRAMLDYQGPVPLRAKLDMESPSGKTSLHEACSEGQFATAELLLSQPGVKVQRENKWGRTSLMEAALYGRCEVLELLVKYHAKVTPRRSIDSRWIDWAPRG